MWASSTISHIPPYATISLVDPGDEVVREAVRLELAAVGVRGPRRAEAGQLDAVDRVEVVEPHRARSSSFTGGRATMPPPRLVPRTPRGSVT